MSTWILLASAALLVLAAVMAYLRVGEHDLSDND